MAARNRNGTAGHLFDRSTRIGVRGAISAFLVHVNRTLRRLREERIVLVDRQVVIIMGLDRLRHAARGLPESVELNSPTSDRETVGFG